MSLLAPRLHYWYEASGIQLCTKTYWKPNTRFRANDARAAHSRSDPNQLRSFRIRMLGWAIPAELMDRKNCPTSNPSLCFLIPSCDILLRLNWPKSTSTSSEFYLILIVYLPSILLYPSFMQLFWSMCWLHHLSDCRILLAINRSFTRGDAKWQRDRLSKLRLSPVVWNERVFVWLVRIVMKKLIVIIQKIRRTFLSIFTIFPPNFWIFWNRILVPSMFLPLKFNYDPFLLSI